MKIAIAGRGNVAFHLTEILQTLNEEVQLLHNITRESDIPIADVYILAVSDNAIPLVAQRIYDNVKHKPLIVHTAGAVSMDIMTPLIARRGVLYPFQTFTKNMKIEMRKVPFLVEANTEEDTALLVRLASLISDNVRVGTQQQRDILHLAGVYACNFTNHMYTIAQEILKTQGLDKELISPLIRECCDKAIKAHELASVQTGPAVRRDTQTINKHKTLLSLIGDKYTDVYECITNSIIDKNGEF